MEMVSKDEEPTIEVKEEDVIVAPPMHDGKTIYCMPGIYCEVVNKAIFLGSFEPAVLKNFLEATGFPGGRIIERQLDHYFYYHLPATISVTTFNRMKAFFPEVFGEALITKS